MVWSTTAPNGAKTVKDNESILQGNTTYIQTEMNIDHFWNIGANEDGHHKYAQMPKFTTGAPATPTSPTIAAGMDLAYFARLKTAAESSVAQGIMPYVRNSGAIMELLGIRACAVFNINPVGFAITVVYGHNLATVNPVTRGGIGLYTVNFDIALPSNNYIPICGGFRQESDSTHKAYVMPISGPNLTSSKTVNHFVFASYAESGGRTELLQAWVACFGG